MIRARFDKQLMHRQFFFLNLYFGMSFPCFARYFLIAICLSVCAVATAGQSISLLRSRPIDLKPSLNRVLEVNVESNEEVVRSAALQKSLERTLNALQPSLIMGFTHLTDETPLSTSQTALFLEVRQKVLAANPHCKFAVTIHVSNYLTVTELLTKLQEITTKLGPDIVNMAVSSSSDVISPTAVARGIEFAHAHGQLVSYEGPANMVPDGIDCFVMKAVNGEVHRDEINNFKMKHHLPMIVQIPNINHSKDGKETLLMSHLAEEQGPFGYHLAYPLQLTPSGNLSANKDTSFLVTLRALMTRYN